MARFHRPGRPAFPPDSNLEHGLPIQLRVRVDRTPVGTTLVLFDPTFGEFLYVALTSEDVLLLSEDLGAAHRADLIDLGAEEPWGEPSDDREDGESCTPWAGEEA